MPMQKAYNIFLSHGGPYNIGRYGSWFILIQHHFAAKKFVLRVLALENTNAKSKGNLKF